MPRGVYIRKEGLKRKPRYFYRVEYRGEVKDFNRAKDIVEYFNAIHDFPVIGVSHIHRLNIGKPVSKKYAELKIEKIMREK